MFASVTIWARQYKIPNPVNIYRYVYIFQYMRKKVVNIAIMQVDILHAVKALSFLVSVQGIPGRGDILSF